MATTFVFRIVLHGNFFQISQPGKASKNLRCPTLKDNKGAPHFDRDFFFLERDRLSWRLPPKGRRRSIVPNKAGVERGDRRAFMDDELGTYVSETRYIQGAKSLLRRPAEYPCSYSTRGSKIPSCVQVRHIP